MSLEDFNMIIFSTLFMTTHDSEFVLFMDSLFSLFAEYAYKAIDALPVSAHPMTQFSTGVMALQVE
jgi:hypothetical protein